MADGLSIDLGIGTIVDGAPNDREIAEFGTWSKPPKVRDCGPIQHTKVK